MKPETLIYDRIRGIIPKDSEKTVFFAAVSRTGYEIFFYSFLGGEIKQCHALAEEGLLDGNVLEEIFEAVADIIRQSKAYAAEQYNIATITVDESGVRMDMKHYAKDARMYRIKKEWKEKNIRS